jgi:hypothetical protein
LLFRNLHLSRVVHLRRLASILCGVAESISKRNETVGCGSEGGREVLDEVGYFLRERVIVHVI